MQENDTGKMNQVQERQSSTNIKYLQILNHMNKHGDYFLFMR